MDVGKQCALLATALRVNFTLNGNPLSHREVFSAVGLLPALAKRANNLCSLCLGQYDIGAKFIDEKRSTTGKRVTFSETTPKVLVLAFLLDVIKELVYTAPSRSTTPLDELLKD